MLRAANCRTYIARRAMASRGFTLTELMVVVAIVGILAVVGISLFREHIYSSRAVEASSMMQSIRAAQERWRSETGTYFDVSSSMTSYYPTSSPGKRKYAWEQSSGNDYANWRLLNPTVTGPVQFGYVTKAGAPGAEVATLGINDAPDFETPGEPWYVIQAQGDTDEDSVATMYAATSFSPELYVQQEGE